MAGIDSTTVLCTCVDDLFAMPAAAMLRSALDHYRGASPLRIVIVDAGLTPRNTERIRRSLNGADVEFVVPDLDLDIARGLADVAHSTYPAAVYLPLFVPEMAQIEAERLIIADADIIFRADLSALADMPFNDATVLAVPDLLACIGDHEYMDADELQLDPATPYFNSGLVVIDVDQWRRQGITAATVEIIRRHPSAIRFADQDALNIVLANRWSALALAWNMTTALTESATTGSDVFAIHFNDRPKPWSRRCVDPRRAAFFAALDATAWAGWRPTRRSEFVSLTRRLARRIGRPATSTPAARAQADRTATLARS